MELLSKESSVHGMADHGSSPMVWRMAPKAKRDASDSEDENDAGSRTRLIGTSAQLKEEDKKRKMLKLEEIINVICQLLIFCGNQFLLPRFAECSGNGLFIRRRR